MLIGRFARRRGGIEMITLWSTCCYRRWPRCAAKHRPAARRRTIAVLGHEQTGIPPEAVELLDVAVEIPMVGSGASLNVAVAGSLVLYRLAGLI
jgi:tRNA C32,U32 (ribose-2'-O)-methylase TrmJ